LTMVRWRDMHTSYARAFQLAFVALCIADISACSSFAPLDDYVTTHNLYGNLCKEEAVDGCDEGSDIASCPTDAPKSHLKEESENENQDEAKENQEGVL